MSEMQSDYLPDIFETYQDGQQITLVEGTLVKLYPPKNTAHGQIQNGEIQDVDGNLGKITFADIIQPLTARNQFISVASTNGAHGLTGVKVKDDGQYGRFIWVTPSATIGYPNGAPAGPPPQQQQRPPAGNRPPPQQQQRRPNPAPRQPQQGQQRPQQPQPPRGNTGGGKPMENQFDVVTKFVDCYFHIHHLVNERMKATIDPSELNVSVFADLVSRATATVFVDVAKSGTASMWNAKLKPRRYPPCPSDPNEWESAYIEKEGSILDGKKLSEVSDDDLRKLHVYYDGKKSNTQFAECVYQAAIDRKIFQQEQQSSPPQQQEEEQHSETDIPF